MFWNEWLWELSNSLPTLKLVAPWRSSYVAMQPVVPSTERSRLWPEQASLVCTVHTHTVNKFTAGWDDLCCVSGASKLPNYMYTCTSVAGLEPLYAPLWYITYCMIMVSSPAAGLGMLIQNCDLHNQRVCVFLLVELLGDCYSSVFFPLNMRKITACTCFIGSVWFLYHKKAYLKEA